MFHSKIFRVMVWILFLLVIAWVASKVTFLFTPAVIVLETFFLPVLLSGLLFYVLSPLVNYLVRCNIPRSMAILLVFLVLGILVTFIFLAVGPVLSQQAKDLIARLPMFIQMFQQVVIDIQTHPLFDRLVDTQSYSPESIASRFSQYFGAIATAVGNNLLNFTVFVTNVVLTLFLVPFIVFYMLKEGDRFPKKITQCFPKPYEKDLEKVLMDMNQVLGSYIKGQMAVSFFVGTLLYLGFLFVGLDYALLLAFIALITNIVPFVGPIIGTIPAMFIALLESPLMAFYTLILIFVVQQIESLFISPRIMGSQLSIHPITIIFLTLFAGKLGGIVGIIIAIPLFGLLRVLWIRGRDLFTIFNRPTELQRKSSRTGRTARRVAIMTRKK